MILSFSTQDHNFGGTTLPGPEVGRRGNKGSCTKLPISVCHPGDGGPGGRALPAGGWLLHSAPASGRNIVVIFDPRHVKTLFTLHVCSLFEMPYLLSFCWDGIGASEVDSWSKCLAVTKLGFDRVLSPKCVLVCLRLYTDLCAFMPAHLCY